jgi:hypothetical protein
MFRILAVAAALLPAGQALSQDSSPGAGTISGQLNYDDALWYIDGAESSNSGWRAIDGGYVVTLDASARAEETPTDAGALTVEITMTGGGAELEADGARISYIPPGGGETLMASDENVDISVEAFQVQGESLTMTASFVATLTPGGADGLVLDPENGVLIEGDLQTTLFAE